MAAKDTKKGKALASLPMAPGSLTGSVDAINQWRQNYNPVLGLNVARARYLLESYPRGDYADLMWTYGAPMLGIENADPDLLALIERRTSAVLEMDWEIKTCAEAEDEKLAEEQEDALREAYDGISNLHEAIEHLCLATFRGFAHAELLRNADGDVTGFALVDQWNIIRNGLRGEWKYNPDARPTTFDGLPGEYLIDPANFVIREVARPVNRIALLKFIRANLCEKDWDAFVEIYGIPGGVVIMPPNVPVEKELEYSSSARRIAEGGSGALPNGSDYKPNLRPQGNNPFRDRLDHLSEKLILAGTGGLLTMLTQSGSGTLAGNAHADTFAQLARKEAAAISSLLQRQFDARFLDRHFPGQPHLAYFDISAEEEVDAAAFIDGVSKLAAAGYLVDPEQIAEKTGYKVSLKPAAPAPVLPTDAPAPLNPADPGEEEEITPSRTAADPEGLFLANRSKAPVPKAQPLEKDQQYQKFLARARDAMAAATAQDLQPLRNALADALHGDDEGLQDRLRALNERLPEIAPQIIAAKHSSGELYGILSAAAASQISTK